MKYFLIILIPFFLFTAPTPPNRTSCYPLLSGDAFRELADHVYDELNQSLNPLDVQSEGVIFVKTDLLQSFFETIHPFIQHSYILISHNSDGACPGVFHPYLEDEKLIAWLGQNYDGFPHPKMHPIPIGIANYCWEHGNGFVLQEVVKEPIEKTYLLHMCFSTHTYGSERIPLYHKFLSKSYCKRAHKAPFKNYLKTLKQAEFTLSPRGNGLDTHRLWESLYVGTIPIVKSSTLDPLYEDLPVLIIQDWNLLNKNLIEEKKKEIQSKTYNMKKLHMDYWKDKIEHLKKRADSPI